MIIEKLTQWSLHKQLLVDKARSIKEALSQIIAVYSTNPSGPLSLFARVEKLKATDLFDFENDRSIIRIPCMRTSVHTVLSVDADKIFTSTLPDPSTGYWVKQYEVKGKNLLDRDYKRWYPFIRKYAKEPTPISELKLNLDIPDDMMKFVVNRMAFEGKLIRVGASSVTSNILSYIDSHKLVSTDLYNGDKQLSTKWLAQKYLKAFGPARIRDFQWWSGTKVSEAKEAVKSLDVKNLDNELIILNEDLSDFEDFESNDLDQIHILPQWDSYTMGYAPDGRSRFVQKEYLNKVYGSIGATGGNAFGVVLDTGQVIGTWKPKFSMKKLQITIELFKKTNKTQLNEKFQDISEFLGSEAFELDFI